MEQLPVCIRGFDDPGRPFHPVAVVKFQGLCGIVFLAESAGKNGTVFDCHRGALCKIGQGGMGSIAQDRRPRGAPGIDHRSFVQCPPETLVVISKIDDRLDVFVPADEIGLQVFPGEFRGPGFFLFRLHQGNFLLTRWVMAVPCGFRTDQLKGISLARSQQIRLYET